MNLDYNYRRKNLTDSDYLKVERKLNDALSQKMETRVKNYTQAKIRNLQNFLEDAEKDNSSFVTSNSHSRDSRFRREPSEILNIEEKKYVNGIKNLKMRMKELQIEVDDKNMTIQGLKKKLNSVKRARDEQLEAIENGTKEELETVKRESEMSIKRQQEMIEKLISDKKNLSNQIAALMQQVQIINTKYSKVAQDLKLKFAREMKNSKEQWIAAEKARREKWMKDKTKEIKETTIKGLEPEIERMLSMGRDDKRKLEEGFNEKFRKEKVRIENEADKKISELKQRLVDENEIILNKEREYIQKCFQDDEDKLRKKYEGEIERLEKRSEEDIKRVELLFEKEKRFLNNKMQGLRRENEDLEKRLRKEKDEETNDTNERFKAQVARIREEYEERENIQRMEIEKNLREKFNEREKEFREKLKSERDKQIEMIVERLMQENSKKSDSEIKRLRAKVKEQRREFDKEQEDIKMELSIFKEKLVEEQQRNGQLESRILLWDKEKIDYESELEEKRLMENKLKVRVKSLLEDAKTEKLRYEAQIKSLNEELLIEKHKTGKIRDEFLEIETDMKRRHNQKLEEQEGYYNQEIDKINDTVQRVVNKKNEEILKLLEEIEGKDRLCDKYEQLLKEQREQLLNSKI